MDEHVRAAVLDTLAQVPPGAQLVGTSMEWDGNQAVLVSDWLPAPSVAPPCCMEWFVDGAHGWRLRLTCGYWSTETWHECDHDHHTDDVVHG